MKREIVLDTETTGLSAENGDKIVAVGAVELIDGKQTGKTFYAEINPLRPVPQDVARIHGLTDEKLKDKPTFPQIAPSFLDFIGDSPLVIHNAPFDMAFLNAELTAAGFAPIAEERIVNILPIAKRLYPEERVSLDALCKKFKIPDKRPLPGKRSARAGKAMETPLHGALFDAQLLAEVYVCLRECDFENCLETGNINDIKKRYENEAHIYTHLITLLTRAAWFGRSDICQWLVDEKAADVNAVDKFGRTALMKAAERGYFDLCQWLVDEKGADVNVKNCRGITSLMYAARNGHLDVCQWLVKEKKNEVKTTDNEGKTALMWTALCGRFEVCKWLADEAGADVNAVDMLERTVLLHAVKGGHLDVCKWLINEKGAEAGGKNILIEAASHGHPDICRWLVNEKGTDVNAKEEDNGETALMYAALNGNSDIVAFLVEAGADVNETTKDGYTALMTATIGGHFDVVRFLTEHGADVNAKAYYGTTAYILATDGNYQEIARFLAEHGADVNAEDAYDETASSKPLTFFELMKTFLRMENGCLSKYEIRRKS